MNPERSAPMRFLLPPTVLVGSLALSILGGVLLPLPWIGRPLSDILMMVGVVTIFAAIWLTLASIRTMARAQTTVRPDRIAAHLVTGGPFRLSRNPIYLAMTTGLFGLGFMAGNLWFFIFGLMAGFLLQKLAIEPEERHLDALFGKRYRDYRKTVRRWI